MSEYDTWEDEEFNDTIVEVSSLDDDAELLRALGEFADKARNIDDVVDEDRMSIRFQVREPSGKRMRDPDFFPRVIGLEGATELIEKIVISLCRHDDPYEFYYDEESPALLYGIKELLDHDAKYFYLMPQYLRKIEAQAAPVSTECLDPLAEKWQEEDSEKYNLYLGAICPAAEGGSKAFRELKDALEDQEGEFNQWLSKAGSVEKVVAQFIKLDEVFMSDTRRHFKKMKERNGGESFKQYVDKLSSAWPQSGVGFTQWDHLNRSGEEFTPGMFGEIDLADIEEKHLNLLIFSIWAGSITIDAETFAIKGYESAILKDVFPEKVEIDRYPWAFVHMESDGVYYMNQMALFEGAYDLFFEVIFSNRFTPNQIFEMRRVAWSIGEPHNFILNMFEEWEGQDELCFFALPVVASVEKPIHENPIDSWLLSIESVMDDFPRKRFGELYQVIHIYADAAIYYTGGAKDNIRAKVAEYDIDPLEKVPFSADYVLAS